MATLAENNWYVTVDSQDISSYVVDVSLSISADENDTTAGSGTDWKSVAAGLKQATATITVVYSDSNLADYIDHMEPGQVVVISYAPEGNTGGNPVHTQSFHLQSITGPNQSVSKEMTTFQLTANSTGSPTKNIWGGDTI